MPGYSLREALANCKQNQNRDEKTYGDFLIRNQKSKIKRNTPFANAPHDNGQIGNPPVEEKQQPNRVEKTRGAKRKNGRKAIEKKATKNSSEKIFVYPVYSC